MNTFQFFKNKLDYIIEKSARASLFFQNPHYCEEHLKFDDLEVWNGISRTCLVSNDWKYVVKFVHSKDARGDACKRECMFWDSSLEMGLSKYFAEPKYIGRYCFCGNSYHSFREDYWNLDFSLSDNEFVENYEVVEDTISIVLDLYEYPQVSYFDISKFIPSKDIEKIVKSSPSSFATYNPLTAALFIQYYDIAEFERLSDFLEWNEINDLHSGNIGVVNGNLIFIDYAGYYE